MPRSFDTHRHKWLAMLQMLPVDSVLIAFQQNALEAHDLFCSHHRAVLSKPAAPRTGCCREAAVSC